MKCSFRGLATFLGGAALIAFAGIAGPNCQPSGGDLGGSGGNGGDSSGGKSSSNGGSSAGGSSNASSGGSNNGGSVSSGGSSASGGKASGGSAGSGSGGSNNGGSPSAGGSSASGGSVSAGGSSASTSSSGGGGTAGTPGALTGTVVTIANGKGVGAMIGYGWVSLGSKDTITDPTCGAGTAITSATACATTTWSTTDSLCVTGSIPALPATPTDSDYTTNWGLSVGLNATDPAGSGIGQAFSSVAIDVTGSPTTGLRAQVHVKGDPDGTSYCYSYTTGALPLAKFAQDCYNTAPTKLIAAASIPNIDKVMIQVSSGTAAITVAKLCITKITFSK